MQSMFVYDFLFYFDDAMNFCFFRRVRNASPKAGYVIQIQIAALVTLQTRVLIVFIPHVNPMSIPVTVAKDAFV